MAESIFTSDVTDTLVHDPTRGMQKKDRTVTVSFRLPMDMVEELMKEVARSGSSPSATLRKVLEKHLSWDRYRLQMNMIPFPDCFANESLKRLSRKDIGDVASQSAGAFRGLVLLKMGRMDLESLLRMMEEWFRDGSINYRRGYANGYHVFVIQHNLDVNWSLYLSNFFTMMCRELANVSCKVELNQDGKTLLLFARNNPDRVALASAVHPDSKMYAALGSARKGTKYSHKDFE